MSNGDKYSTSKARKLISNTFIENTLFDKIKGLFMQNKALDINSVKFYKELAKAVNPFIKKQKQELKFAVRKNNKLSENDLENEKFFELVSEFANGNINTLKYSYELNAENITETLKEEQDAIKKAKSAPENLIKNVKVFRKVSNNNNFELSIEDGNLLALEIGKEKPVFNIYYKWVSSLESGKYFIEHYDTGVRFGSGLGYSSIDAALFVAKGNFVEKQFKEFIKTPSYERMLKQMQELRKETQNSITNSNSKITSEKTIEKLNERSNNSDDEFRRLQEESRRELDNSSWQERSSRNDETLRERLSTIFRRKLDSRGFNSSSTRTLYLKSNKNTEFRMYENVDGYLFHDIFEIARTYLLNGELVDLHDNYDNVSCYLNEDGLSGFAIEENGNLISVFNLDKYKPGFLSAIASIIKNKTTHLDCYVSPNQNLQEMYSKIFGFKTASIMDYNMEYDHDDIAKNHNMPQVAFMVNTNRDVIEKHFNKDQYDEAYEYQQSYLKPKQELTKVNKNKLTTFETTQEQEQPKKKVKPEFKGQDINTPLEEDYARDVKSNANYRLGKVIKLQDAKAIAKEIDKFFKDNFGVNYINKTKKARTLFEMFNTTPDVKNSRQFIKLLKKIKIHHFYLTKIT